MGMDGGGKGWFDRGRVMVVEKGRFTKGGVFGGGGSGGGGLVAWEITTTRAREPE